MDNVMSQANVKLIRCQIISVVRSLPRMEKLPKQDIDDVLVEFYRLESIMENDLDEHQKKYVIIRLITIIEQFFRCVVEIKFKNVPSPISGKMELDPRIIDEAVGKLSKAVRKKIKNRIVSLTYSFQGTDEIKSQMDKFNISVFGHGMKENDFEKLFELRHSFVHSVDPQPLQSEEVQRYYAMTEKLMRKTLDQMKNMSISFYLVKGGAFYKLGNLDVAKECFKKALDDFSDAIRSAPRNPSLHLGMGMAQQDLNEYSKAIESFTKAINLGAKDFIAYFGKGEALYRLGRNEKAIEFFDKTISVDPDSAFAHYLKGKALFNIGRVEMALACFDRAIENNPNSPQLHFEKWRILQERGMSIWASMCFERAKEWAHIVLTENPADANIQFVIGICLLNFEQDNEAQTCFEKTLELNPKHLRARAILDEMHQKPE